MLVYSVRMVVILINTTRKFLYEVNLNVLHFWLCAQIYFCLWILEIISGSFVNTVLVKNRIQNVKIF